MLVRLNIGRKAGEIQDIEISAAKAMIHDGRASAVEYENGAETEGVAQLVAAADSAGEPEKSDSAKPAKAAKKK